MEKSPEAKEKATEKKEKQETESTESSHDGNDVESLVKEPKDDSDNGSTKPHYRQRERSRGYRDDAWFDSESREERGMSFEEKLRAFKKQSEERLLHIKRSREAKIGKKKIR